LSPLTPLHQRKVLGPQMGVVGHSNIRRFKTASLFECIVARGISLDDDVYLSFRENRELEESNDQKDQESWRSRMNWRVLNQGESGKFEDQEDQGSISLLPDRLCVKRLQEVVEMIFGHASIQNIK